MTQRCLGVLLGGLVIGALTAPSAIAAPVGTAFTFQGQLKKDGVPVTDTCRFRFSLWDDPNVGSGAQFGPTNNRVADVVAGLFTVVLDFDPGAFNGEARFVQIEACCPSPSCTFEVLQPRQELTPAPQALRALEGAGPPNALEVEAASGKVGIGGPPNPAASAILQVAGGARFTDFLTSFGPVTSGETITVGGTAGVDGVMFPDGTLQTTAAARGSNGHSLNASDGSPVDAVFVDADGNTGIGTTSALSRLQVQATGANDPSIGNGWGDFSIAGTPGFGEISGIAMGVFGNTSDCCAVHTEPGCDDATCEAIVCGAIPECCSVGWDAADCAGGASFCSVCATALGGGGAIWANTLGGSGELTLGTDVDADMLVLWRDGSRKRVQVTTDLSVTGDATLGGTVFLAGTVTSSSGTVDFTDENLVTSGVIESTSGGIKFPDGTTQTSASSGDGHSLDAADGDPVDAIFVDNGGDVGIGTTGPIRPLHVRGASPPNTADGQVVIQASETSGAADTGAGLRLMGHDGTTDRDLGTVQAFKENGTVGNTRSYMRFTTRGESGGVVERVRINSDGNVGIGTTTPSSKLTVVSDNDPIHTRVFRDVVGTIGGGTGYVQWTAKGTESTPSSIEMGDRIGGLFSGGYDGSGFNGLSAATVYVAEEDFTSTARGAGIEFQTTDPGGTSRTTKMAIEGDGDVGIGTTMPDTRFHALTSGSTNVGIFESTHANNDAWLWLINPVSRAAGSFNDLGIGAIDRDLHVRAGSSSRLVVQGTTGNVGIGTANPESALTVGDGTSTADARIPNGGVCVDSDGDCTPPAPGALRIGDGGIVGADSANNNVLLVPDGSGNVGIGTPSPTGSLEVSRNSTLGTPQLMLTESEADYSRLTFGNTENSRFWTIAGLTKDDQVDGFPTDNLNFYHSTAGNGLSMHVGAGNQAWVGIGTTVPQARLDVRGRTRTEILEIAGADVAEKFPVSGNVEPGMVVEIDPDKSGKLRLAHGAYNRRVAGVVSGAGGLSVGAILGNLPGMEDATPVALSGRVYVRCDTSNGPIEPGDLLTTSDTTAYAMKVTDHGRAQGAILGKAMTSLEQGTGLVLVLVSLQ